MRKNSKEYQKVIYDWNNTQTELGKSKCMHTLLEEQVLKFPTRPAVVYEDEVITFKQLNEKANQVAHFLQKSGVQVETSVAMLMERSIDMIIVLFGILKAGGHYVPMDLDYPLERQRVILEDSQSDFIVTQSKYKSRFTDENRKVICIDEIENKLSMESDKNLSMDVKPSHLAYIIFTSGSTGRPKGVQIEHESVFYFFHSFNSNIYRPSIGKMNVSLNAPVVFDASVKQIVSLFYGHTLHIIPNSVRKNPEQFVTFIRENSINLLDCTPSHLNALIQMGLLDNERFVPQIICVGGEPIDKKLWEITSKFSKSEFYNFYGPTECTVNSTFALIEEGNEPTIGRPKENVKTYILDGQLNPLDIGSVGELYIGGKGLARGYTNMELTKERFINNPFCIGEKIYKTGDLVKYTNDGQIIYIGRSDTQVKINGYRIELNEINEKIKSHSFIKDSVVLDYVNSNGVKRIAAYYISDGPLEIEELKNHLKKHLPRYMTPTRWIKIARIPIDVNGKVDKKSLVNLLSESQTEMEWDSESIPKSKMEVYLANIWCNILDLNEVNLHTDFFEEGGDSILATQVISQIRMDLQIEVPVETLFEYSTIDEFSKMVETKCNSSVIENTEIPLENFRLSYEDYTLSYSQRRLWFLDKLHPNSSVYNEYFAVEIKGTLDISIMGKSLQNVVNRHEILRTTFSELDGEPYQVVHANLEVKLNEINLSNIENNDAIAKELMEKEISTVFQLSEGPLIRFNLMKMAKDIHLFFISVHHIVFDRWSMNVLIREISEFYNSALNGRNAGLDPILIQYKEYNAWKERWFNGDRMKSQLDYWKTKLSGELPVLHLPTDYSRKNIQTYKGAREKIKIPNSVFNEMKNLSIREKVTPFMSLLAAFNILLNRYTNQTDLLVGSPISNRNHKESENLIGFFVNTIVFRTDLSKEQTFKELMSQVKNYAINAYSNQDLPFEKLVEELNPNRDLSHSPIFQVMFAFQNTPMSSFHLTGLQTHPYEVTNKTAKFDLTLFIEDDVDGIWAKFEYNSDLFKRETIKRLLANYLCILESIINQPEKKISELQILPKDERKLLMKFSRGTNEENNYSSIHHIQGLFKDQVNKFPNNVAVECENKQLTYKELDEKSNQFANYLKEMGIGKDSIVSINLERSIELIITIMGTLKAGAAYNLIDINYPTERVKYMVIDSHSRILISNHSNIFNESELGDALMVLSHNKLKQEINGYSTKELALRYDPESLAYINYTSGSTGMPKGVMVTHKSLSNYLHWAVHHYYDTGGFGSVVHTSISFDSTITVLLPPLLIGKKVVLIPESYHLYEVSKKLMEYRGSSVLKMTPSHLKIINEEIPSEELVGLTNKIVLGGEPLPKGVVDHWKKYSPKTILINEYGPTETVVGCSTFTASDYKGSYDYIPIGKPITNSKLYVLDKLLNPVPIGVPGELYIGGVGVSKGYLNKSTLTKNSFIHNPFSTDARDRLYKTGDIAKFQEDGNLIFLGREDSQIKIRGYRIELGEIEENIRNYSAIKDAIVTVGKDFMNENELLVYLVIENKDPFSITELKDYLKKCLPDYMVPSKYMILKDLQLTPNGKLDLKRLPKFERMEQINSKYIKPRTPEERTIADIWREVLGVQSIGIHDNFFKLGGHSLLAIKVATKINVECNTDISLIKLFESPTLKDLAEEVYKIRNTKQQVHSEVKIGRISRNQFVRRSIQR